VSTYWKVYPDCHPNLPRNWIIDERVDGQLTRSSGGYTAESALLFAGERAGEQGLRYLGAVVYPQGFVLEFEPIVLLTSA